MIAYLLCAFALSPADPAQLPAGAAVENVVRLYDLTMADITPLREGDMLAMALLPGITTWQTSRDSFYEADEARTYVVELIYALFGEEFQYEGRELSQTGDGRLVVRGPEELHARIGGLLDFLEKTIHARATLAVDVWTVSANRPVEAPGAVVPIEAARAWTAGLPEIAQHKSYRLQVHPDQPSLLKLTRDVHVVLDYDVEIAQGATIADPITATASVGTRLALRGAPSPSGLHLALSWKHGSLVETTNDRSLSIDFMISAADKDPQIYQSEAYASNLEVFTRATSLSTHLPDGHALILETSARLGRTVKEREFVVLQSAGGTLSLADVLEIDGAGNELVMASMGSLAPPTMAHWGTLLWPSNVVENLDTIIWDNELLSGELRAEDLDFFLGALRHDLAALSVEIAGDWLIAHSAGGRGISELPRLKAALDEMQSGTKTLELCVRLDQGGEMVAQALAPVRVGSSCALVIGVEGFEQRDYDVEVAQFAATADPVVYSTFDGLALYLRPFVRTSGELALRVRGSGHLLLESRPRDLGSPLLGSLDQSDYAHLFVNETVSLEAGDDGVWRATFGDLAGTGREDLALSFEVR